MSQKARKGTTTNTSLTLAPAITSKTVNQKLIADAVPSHDVISMRGLPGTGKTFWALFQAFKLVLDKRNLYERVIVVRSTVAVRDTGFLPGTLGEKVAPFEAPYKVHCTKIFGRGDAYEIAKKSGLLVFESTSHLRGIEWNNAIVVVDEPQNMADNELHTINTRFGEECKLFFCGDTGQDDLTSERYNERSGYGRMNEIHDRMPNVFGIYLGIDDILRSGYLKTYILARENITDPKLLLG